MTLIPVAISALRSLVHLRGRVIEIRDVERIDDPLPLLLPALPPNLIRNQTKDPGDMQKAFSQDPVFRAALEARGLLDQFDKFHANLDPQDGGPLEPERHRDLFWRFMGLYYQISDQKAGQEDTEIGPGPLGIDRFIVHSSVSGDSTSGLRILRVTAETLVEFLGDNAGVFLAGSSNKLVISSILREFASRSDIENDTPKRILKVLVGSVAVAAAENGQHISDNPAAAMLFSSLGRARTEFGDDFVARIVSHEGFTAVVSDWAGSLMEEPYLVELLADMKGLDAGSYDPADPTTLPARLQLVFGALKNTVGVIGDHVGTADALSREDVFRDVFGAVLSGITQNSRAVLQDELQGDRFMASLLQAVIANISRTGTLENNDLIAPVFSTLMGTFAKIIPEVAQDRALGRAEQILVQLAARIQSPDMQATLTELERFGGESFARGLMIDLFSAAHARADVLREGESERSQAIAATLLGQIPGLLQTGLNREGTVRVVKSVLGQMFPADSAEGAFVFEIVPQLTDIVKAIGDGRPTPEPELIENAMGLLIQRIEGDRPVWQRLHEAGHLPIVIQTISSVLAGEDVPAHLSSQTLLDIADEALGGFASHGLTISDLAVLAADPEAFLREKIRTLLTQALHAAVEKLGREARGDDMPRIIRKILRKALKVRNLENLSDADLAAAIDEALAERI
ncbi:MAG: hypothetical protein R8G34_07940 [Paracoccaceae bacterium]|nr:hypothetical protein [Paracoccaceae bacterium]